MSSLSYYIAQRTNYENAITRILKTGQESENASGGSSRKIKDPEIDKLEALLCSTNKIINNWGKSRAARMKMRW